MFYLLQEDNVVRDLEELKNTIGKSLEMVKSHSEVFTNINGQKEAHSNINEQLNENGKLIAKLGQQLDALPGPNGAPIAKLRTNVDIPSKGIHKSIEQPLDSRQFMQPTENGNRRAPNMELLTANPDNLPVNGYLVPKIISDMHMPELIKTKRNVYLYLQLDKYGSYSGIQYTPLDMAEYVFWTGDEKGVTLAIEEFLQEGLMTREEAISFLQEIKYNLDYLQKHYTEVGINTRERARSKENVPNGLFYNNFKDVPSNNKEQRSDNRFKSSQKKNSLAWADFLKEQAKFDQNLNLKQNEQYDELLERLRVADFLYTEYSLEEVIYQLAKVMFTQSLTRGSLEAQQSLQKFTTFLENEAEQGRISRALEKKVLDVLIAALTDTLSEHPELTGENNQDNTLAEISSRENLMKQLLKFTPSEQHKTMRELISPNFAENLKQVKQNSLSEQLKNDDRGLTLDIAKYKHI
ncbi:cytochrome b561/ferric reductase transmembrane [Holotrichia oblita]|uniref:Cytochrome b561/ferric reductase transmembrane n=1 Tax=Holotrichia oblita TaxID=644536 RepID=A0ACB9T0B2_HOLOL|nr:cytochrome b561/ferric reductase transmembrane [Holotrichia oblita]